ncbi:MAG: ribosomal protein S18-alanine N-acetyltransferase [candidate division NC10 bacterium]|nr:ribosomal protein S18-alanine N-acetyltransferase [candidate division NC10 bacterium]
MSLSARVRIRPMVRRDLPQVAALELACFGREAWPLQAFKDLLAAFAGSRPARGAFWVAEDQATGGVVGYAGVEVSALWGEMDIINIAVASSHRRRGVGCLLIERIVRLCRQRGVSLLWLRVRASNRGARRFYRRMGFQERGRFAGYYLEPDESAVIMAMEPEER